jgi:hypothetical protein
MADDRTTKTGQLIRCSNEKCRKMVENAPTVGNKFGKLIDPLLQVFHGNKPYKYTLP